MRVVDADKLATKLRELEEIHINNSLWYKILDIINDLSTDEITMIPVSTIENIKAAFEIEAQREIGGNCTDINYVHRSSFREASAIVDDECAKLTKKTKCLHPDNCHECDKILTCDYYKK